MTQQKQPTLEQIAKQRMNAELQRQGVGRSAFTAEGRFKSEEMGQGQFSLGEYLDISGIDWAPDPYGSDHCTWLSRLVDYMSSLPGKFGGVTEEPFDLADRKVLHCVSMLYCTGRKEGEHNYAARSAAFAERFLRAGAGMGTSHWNKESVREDVCRLIYRHNDPVAIREDARLKVFTDACRYELARLSPNSLEGTLLLKEHIKPELFFSGWAQSKENFRGWMVTRGWK